MHVINKRYELPPRDGFDLTVHVENDSACNPWDYEASFSRADLASWGLSWRFVGIIVIASQNGSDLGNCAEWMQPHGVMGDEKPVDALRRSGAFSGVLRETLISEAVMDAVDTRRRSLLAENGHEGASEFYSIPTIEKAAKPVDPRFPWVVTWPDGQVTSYRNRQAAEKSVLITVRQLWIGDEP